MKGRLWLMGLCAVLALGAVSCGGKTKTKARSSTSSTAAAPTSAPSSSAPVTSSAPAPSGYQALWPFRTPADARAWQAAHRPGAADGWHLDAGQTARRFTTDFLEFAAVDQVVDVKLDAKGAHVAVGYRPEQGRTATAAIVHLVRFGSGSDAPWEVVGTDDTTFSLTRPAYGSVVPSPLTVGGRITGVDESIRVAVRQLSPPGLLGEKCCLAAGGTNSSWETSVEIRGATDPAITVVASTGGHVSAVERFTVTGLRSAG